MQKKKGNVRLAVSSLQDQITTLASPFLSEAQEPSSPLWIILLNPCKIPFVEELGDGCVAKCCNW